MRADHRQEAEEILHAVLNYPPEDRASFIFQACAGDPALIHDIDTLLSHLNTSESAAELDQPKTDLNSCNHLAAEEQVDRLIGRRLGPYRIEREVARGGMGTVYEALRVDKEFSKRVAIKVVNNKLRIMRAFANILAEVYCPEQFSFERVCLENGWVRNARRCIVATSSGLV